MTRPLRDGPAAAAVADAWRDAALPAVALERLALEGDDPVLPSSFRVATAAQASMAAAGLAAAEFAHRRGAPRVAITVDLAHAALECTSWFALDGVVPPMWDPLSGLYACADGHVRVHANFRHHRDGVLRLLGLDPAHADGDAATGALRAQVEARLRQRSAFAFEQQAADAGLVVAALRTFAQWDATPQAAAVAARPLVAWQRLGDAPVRARPVPAVHGTTAAATTRPLAGVRVLDLTRILAGPVATRTLAALGADVLMVNGPHLPNIDAIADCSRGKRSSHVDLRHAEGRAMLDALVRGAHVVVQGYRPGALAAFGFDAAAMAARAPGLVVVELSAYGDEGPWGGRRGFDSLVQTATGFNDAEARAFGEASPPRALPMQILDHATGQWMAFAACALLARQQHEGGSWHARLSLARTGLWLRTLGRVADGFDAVAPDRARWIERSASGFGALDAFIPALRLDGRRLTFDRPSMPPGSHAPRWH